MEIYRFLIRILSFLISFYLCGVGRMYGLCILSNLVFFFVYFLDSLIRGYVESCVGLDSAGWLIFYSPFQKRE